MYVDLYAPYLTIFYSTAQNEISKTEVLEYIIVNIARK